MKLPNYETDLGKNLEYYSARVLLKKNFHFYISNSKLTGSGQMRCCSLNSVWNVKEKYPIYNRKVISTYWKNKNMKLSEEYFYKIKTKSNATEFKNAGSS